MQDWEFERIRRRALRGDEHAWTLIYDWLAPPLIGYLRTHGAPWPEDVASEVFLQVVRDIGSFRGDAGKFRSWVFSIGHNRMIDQARAERRRPAVPVEDGALHVLLAPDESESEAVDNLVSWELERLFRDTTDEQREVLVLRFIVGLTMHEIADALGKQLGAVKALQRRGLDAIREDVERHAYPLGASEALTST